MSQSGTGTVLYILYESTALKSPRHIHIHTNTYSVSTFLADYNLISQKCMYVVIKKIPF